MLWGYQLSSNCLSYHTCSLTFCPFALLPITVNRYYAFLTLILHRLALNFVCGFCNPLIITAPDLIKAILEFAKINPRHISISKHNINIMLSSKLNPLKSNPLNPPQSDSIPCTTAMNNNIFVKECGENNGCHWCGRPSTLICPQCEDAHYCGEEHLKDFGLLDDPIS